MMLWDCGWREPAWKNRCELRGAGEPIEVRDQPAEQGGEVPGLLVRKPSQRIAVAPKQGRDRLRQACEREFRQRDPAATFIVRVGRAADKPVRSMRVSICAMGGCWIRAKCARSRCVSARPIRNATRTGK